MLRARVKYVGRRAYKNNYRYAEITTPTENTDVISGMKIIELQIKEVKK